MSDSHGSMKKDHSFASWPAYDIVRRDEGRPVFPALRRIVITLQ
jgi:hypothetical protein